MYNFIADERPVLVKDHSMQQPCILALSALFLLIVTFVNSVCTLRSDSGRLCRHGKEDSFIRLSISCEKVFKTNSNNVKSLLSLSIRLSPAAIDFTHCVK
jgi:hypothetical protein